MKIIKFILIYSVSINYFAVHAMDLTPLTSAHNHNRFQINTIQDIPKLSLAHISPCLKALPDAKRNTFPSQSLIANVTLQLPQELIYHITLYMLDCDEKSATIFFNTPLWYAYKKYDEAREMIRNSSLKIKPPLGLLFRLAVEQQKEIMGLVTQSSLSKILHSTIVVDEYEQQKIQSYSKEIQEKFFAQDDIAVITDDIKEECTVNFHGETAIGGISGCMGGGIVFLATYFSNISGDLVLGCLFGMPFLGCATGLIGGGIYEAQTVKQKAQKIKLYE